MGRMPDTLIRGKGVPRGIRELFDKAVRLS